MSEEVPDAPDEVQRNEELLVPEIGDARLIKVVIKIRDKIAEVTKEFDSTVAVLKAQKKEVEMEILRRLQARGATQTKTEFGTSFISEKTQYTIADEDAFGRFVMQQQDYEFYQKRAKVEHVQQWMTNNGGVLPPGLNVFREFEINTRVPTRKPTKETPSGPTERTELPTGTDFWAQPE